MDAEQLAKTSPDTRISDENGNYISAEDVGGYIDRTLKAGDEDTFLHNVAIACSLTHGE
jgi:hypothetical protein